jgi:predicted DNA-binding WGR domain protein
MASVRWSADFIRLRGGPVRLDNLALVPASLLPHKARYQRIANQLPPGAVLVVLPTEAGPERDALQTTAARFLAKGHPVTTIEAEEVLGRSRRTGAPASSPASQASTTPASSEPPSIASPSSSTPTWMPGEVPAFSQELRLVQLDTSQEPARFWVLQWYPTLFGGVALVQLQGRIGRPAHGRVVLHTDKPQLDATVTQLVRRRLRQGYQLIDWV